MEIGVEHARYSQPTVLIPRKGSLNNVFYVDKPFWNVDTIFYTEIDTSAVLPRYLYYAICNAHIERFGTNGARPSLTQSALNKLLLPIPPIEIQREVVRILDSFRELDTTLSEELFLQQKQLAAIRDRQINLLDSMCNGNIQSLADVADIRVGNKPDTILANGPYTYINAGVTPSGFCAQWNTVGDTITTPSRGQGGIGFVGYQTDNFWCGPLCYRIHSNRTDISNRYLYYWLCSHKMQIKALTNEGGTPAVNRKDLIRLRIPVPSLDLQQSIVSKLDSMQSLIENIHAERDARQKQYEYYRDEIFNTFERKA